MTDDKNKTHYSTGSGAVCGGDYARMRFTTSKTNVTCSSCIDRLIAKGDLTPLLVEGFPSGGHIPDAEASVPVLTFHDLAMLTAMHAMISAPPGTLTWDQLAEAARAAADALETQRKTTQHTDSNAPAKTKE